MKKSVLLVILFLMACGKEDNGKMIQRNNHRHTYWLPIDILDYIEKCDLDVNSLFDPDNYLSPDTIAMFDKSLLSYKGLSFVIIHSISPSYKENASVDVRDFKKDLTSILNDKYSDFSFIVMSIKDQFYVYIDSGQRLNFLEKIRLKYAIHKNERLIKRRMYDQAFINIANNYELSASFYDLGIPSFMLLFLILVFLINTAFENCVFIEKQKNRVSFKKRLYRINQHLIVDPLLGHAERENCLICMEHLLSQKNCEIEFLDCNHRFHSDCLKTITDGVIVCPLCVEDREDYVRNLIELQMRQFNKKLAQTTLESMVDEVMKKERRWISKSEPIITTSMRDERRSFKGFK